MDCLSLSYLWHIFGAEIFFRDNIFEIRANRVFSPICIQICTLTPPVDFLPSSFLWHIFGPETFFGIIFSNRVFSPIRIQIRTLTAPVDFLPSSFFFHIFGPENFVGILFFLRFARITSSLRFAFRFAP